MKARDRQARSAVLILGGGIMQLPAVRIAKARGWTVNVAALSFVEEVRELADRCLEVDVSCREAVEEAARGLFHDSGLDGIFTAGTDFSTTVAWVAERLGLPGIPFSTALDATDKVRMRERLRDGGVRGPRFAMLEPGCKVERPQGLTFPLVVKPVDNMGARGVRRVDTEGEFRAALESAWAQSRSARAIVEEFLEGPELSLDAVIHRGRVTVCGVADRHIFFAPYFVEMGHTMPSALPPEAIREAEEVFIRGIQALALREGAAKGDIKLTAGGAAVGEIAARLSGGYMSGWTYPLASGVEVTEAALNIAVGLPPGELRPRRAYVSAERAFVSIPGRIQGITGLQEAGNLPGVREVFLRVHPGQEVELPINNMGKCGNVISAAPSRQAAVEAAEAAVRWIEVRLAPATESTDGFLSACRQSTFRAFPEPSPQLSRALSRLPDLAGKAGSGGRAVGIVTPPEVEREQGRDWHGRTLAEALRAVCRITGAAAVRDPGRGMLSLGAPFWRGLLKGSVQAGVYLIDTLRRDGSRPGTAWSYLAKNS